MIHPTHIFSKFTSLYDVIPDYLPHRAHSRIKKNSTLIPIKPKIIPFLILPNDQDNKNIAV